MPQIRSLPELLAAVAQEREATKALAIIAQAALDLTFSRHAMVAVMDEEAGVLRVQYGAGEEYGAKAQNRILNVDRTQGEGIVAYVAATGESVRTGNVEQEPRYRQLFSNTVS